MTESPVLQLERRIVEKLGIEKLGIEEKHEYLRNAVPIYRKISLALIPPLLASISYLRQESTSDSGDMGRGIESPKEEELDVTKPIGEERALTSFLNMLATALVYGANSFVTIKQLCEGAHKHWADSQMAGYGFESDSEESSDSKDSLERRMSPTKTKAQLEEPVIPIIRAVLPPRHEWTEWQSSVVANVDFASLEAVLIRVAKPEDEAKEENTMSQDYLERLGLQLANQTGSAFELDDSDHLYASFDAWLIKDVLLQGHVYLTKEAFCFYLNLPAVASEQDTTLYSGVLGLKMAHYGDSYFSSVAKHRFWAVLTLLTLSVYTGPTELYFPVKVIDLRIAISCEITTDMPLTPASEPQVPSRTSTSSLVSPTELMVNLQNAGVELETPEDSENVQAGVWLKLVCTGHTYRFHTGSIYLARHWLNSITKVIFELQNANAQREVILKIPYEDVLDFQKNFVLADSAEEDETDTPITFSIKYVLTAPPDSTFQKLKKKTKKYMAGQTESFDFVHFTFFQRGDYFTDLFNQIFHDNASDVKSLNSRIKLRAKRAFGDDSSDTGSIISKPSKQPSRVITTLQPEVSTTSLAGKVAAYNKRAYQPQRLMYRDNAGMDELRLSKINLKKVFRRTSEASSNTEINDLKPRSSFEEGGTLQMPKPFSVTSLKNLNMLMVTSKRSIDEVELRYSEFESRIQEEDSSLPSLTSTSEDGTTTSGDSRKSKFKSFKRSLKTVSTMGGVWLANPEHYEQIDAEDDYYVTDFMQRETSEGNFKKHFSLTDARLVASYYAHLLRSIPVYGKLYLGNEKLCFRSLLPGVSTKMIIPLKDVETCVKETGVQLNYSGLTVTLAGMDEVVLQFGTQKARDDCHLMILRQLEFMHSDELWTPQTHTVQPSIERLREETEELALTRVRNARLRLLEDKIGTAAGIEFPLILEDSLYYFTEVRPANSYKFTLLTIGSRGDVQPYIALGKGLVAEGHIVTIATHIEFKDWILGHGLLFKEIAGNPTELMSLMVTHGSMSVGFLKEASTKFRGWINELLASSWEACQGADILIESPSAMGGIHIAEALGIPYMRAFTMPWTRTRAYPHAFVVPDHKRGGSYNFLTHVMFENVFWKGISGQVNRWRNDVLGLPRTNLVKLQQSRVPFLYNISPTMFPPSVDFPDWVKVTGYWFLDEGNADYSPPPPLEEFLATAKENGEKVVYIGFGSIVVSDAASLTKAVVEAVVELGVKCILNKGWSDRLRTDKSAKEVELPSQIYNSGAIPHDWLFPRIDAAVHHGGSGTTGATLRAGLPTIIKPFFGDQFFYASRVEDMGVGMALKNLNTKSLTKALTTVTTEPKYREKAQIVAQHMEHEMGVLTAIEAIYTELAYSKSLMLTIRQNSEQRRTDDKSGTQTPNIDEEDFEFDVDSESDSSSTHENASILEYISMIAGQKAS